MVLKIWEKTLYMRIADREEVFRVAEKVKKEVGDVTILVNNAGIAFVKSFLNHSLDEIRRVIDVNVTAHYWTLKAFLPSMIEKNYGHIVALSSVTGLVGAPYGTVYCPTKFTVKGQGKGTVVNPSSRSTMQSVLASERIYVLPYRLQLVSASPVRKIHRPIMVQAFSINGRVRPKPSSSHIAEVRYTQHGESSAERKKKIWGTIRGSRGGEKRPRAPHTHRGEWTRNDTWRDDRESRGCPRDKSASTRV